MGMPGPQKINRYGLEFKLRAVRMSEQSGVLVKDVAESLCIHPFMLSKWRKQVRDGELSGKSPALDAAAVAELQRLREVEGKYRQLQMEHDLLKKLSGLPQIERRSLRLHRGKPAGVARRDDVQAARRHPGRLLRLASTRTEPARTRRPWHHRADPQRPREQPEHLWQSAGDPGHAAGGHTDWPSTRRQAHARRAHPRPQCAALSTPKGGPESLLQAHPQFGSATCSFKTPTRSGWATLPTCA